MIQGLEYFNETFEDNLDIHDDMKPELLNPDYDSKLKRKPDPLETGTPAKRLCSSLPCYYCNEEIEKSQMLQHVQVEHYQPCQELQGFQCYHCGQILGESKIKDHISEKHTEHVISKMFGEIRQFQCSACHRMFKTSENLEIHICGILPTSWLHTDHKSQKCPKCDQTFVKYGDLLCHYNIDHKINDVEDDHIKCSHGNLQFPCEHFM